MVMDISNKQLMEILHAKNILLQQFMNAKVWKLIKIDVKYVMMDFI